MRRICETCHYFEPMGAPGQRADVRQGGECRKRAPVIGTGTFAERDAAPWAYWPTVNVTHWCGDWRANKRER